MRTRPKDLGTQLETWMVRAAAERGLTAERLAEGGIRDRGDLRILTNTEWVGEAKNRGQLNIHIAVQDAMRKAGHNQAFVVWKRMVRKPGQQNRYQPAPPIIALQVDTFLELLKETR